MTDKQGGTVVVSRELAERLTSAHVSIAGPEFWTALKELRALLAAPVEQQGEPVAIIGRDYQLLWFSPSGMESHAALCHRTGIEVGDKLYRHAQPPAKVVLPNKKFFSTTTMPVTDACIARGYNLCLDEITELNGICPCP